MAVLTADLQLESKGHQEIRAFDVVNADIIYKGSLVSIDTSGWAYPSTDTANESFVGIAVEKADNSSGAAGAIKVKVATTGCFKLTCSSLEQADVGRLMYVSDDNTVGDKSVPTNDIPVGMLVEYLSATSGWVEIGKGVAGVASS